MRSHQLCSHIHRRTHAHPHPCGGILQPLVCRRCFYLHIAVVIPRLYLLTGDSSYIAQKSPCFTSVVKRRRADAAEDSNKRTGFRTDSRRTSHGHRYDLSAYRINASTLYVWMGTAVGRSPPRLSSPTSADKHSICALCGELADGATMWAAGIGSAGTTPYEPNEKTTPRKQMPKKPTR